MRVYDYKCQECEHVEELFVTKEEETIDCPQCKAHSFTKQISTPRFVDPNGTAYKELKEMERRVNVRDEWRARNANGTNNSSNIIVR